MNPMVDEPLTYFRQWVPQRSDLLQAMEQEARAEQIPIVGPLVGQLLYILARSMNAHRILELGTAIGYSSLFLASACRQTGGKLLTLEINDALARRARIYLQKEGLSPNCGGQMPGCPGGFAVHGWTAGSDFHGYRKRGLYSCAARMRAASAAGRIAGGRQHRLCGFR